MVYFLDPPKEGIIKVSTKDAIISILGFSWPLTAKQIFKIAEKEYSITATYQAIHKMLNELVEAGIITKDAAKYSISRQWIKKIRLFSETLDKEYSNTTFNDFKDRGVITLYFNNFISLVRFIIHTFHERFPREKPVPLVAMMSHPIGPFGATEEDIQQLKSIFKIPYFGLYRGNTLLDNYLTKTLERWGKKSLMGINCPADGDIIIHGAYIAQIFYPVSFKLAYEKIFNNVHSIEKLDLVELFNLYSDNYSFKVVITNNPDLACNLREEAIQLYNYYGKGGED